MFLTEDIAYLNGEYFFAAKEINAICSFNEKDGQIQVLRTDGSGDIWAYRRYGRVFKYDNKLYFLPLWAHNLLIYNLDTKTFETIPLKKIDGYNNDHFFAGIIVQEKLVMVGCQYPAIAVLDFKTHDLSYYEEPFKELLPKHKKGGDCFFRCDITNNGTKVYMASCLSNQILEFDVVDGSYEWHNIGGEKNTYSGIAYDGQKFWISPRRGKKAACWDRNNNTIKEFDLPITYESDDDKGNCTCLGAVYDGKNIIFPGMEINKTMIIDPLSVDFEQSMKVLDKGYAFYGHREGFNYALNKYGELEVYSPDDSYKPLKMIKTTNDKTLIASFIHETGEIIHEGYKELELVDFINMVTV